jgi:hypothetical protein
MTSVCKLFNQITSDQVFDHEREMQKLRQDFPEKLIEAVGGLDALKAFPQVDCNPHKKVFKKFSSDFSSPSLNVDSKSEDIFNQEITGPVRGKTHPFLFFKICAQSMKIKFLFSILLFKEESSKNWKVKALCRKNPTDPLTDSDVLYLFHLFNDKASYLRDFHAKNNSMPGKFHNVKIYRETT